MKYDPTSRSKEAIAERSRQKRLDLAGIFKRDYDLSEITLTQVAEKLSATVCLLLEMMAYLQTDYGFHTVRDEYRFWRIRDARYEAISAELQPQIARPRPQSQLETSHARRDFNKPSTSARKSARAVPVRPDVIDLCDSSDEGSQNDE